MLLFQKLKLYHSNCQYHSLTVVMFRLPILLVFLVSLLLFSKLSLWLMLYHAGLSGLSIWLVSIAVPLSGFYIRFPFLDILKGSSFNVYRSHAIIFLNVISGLFSEISYLSSSLLCFPYDLPGNSLLTVSLYDLCECYNTRGGKLFRKSYCYFFPEKNF